MEKQLPETQRIFGLDILRAIAILTVLFRHMFSDVPLKTSEIVVDSLYLNGVEIFFVLSGYLVGGILFRTITKKGPYFKTLFEFWRDR